MKPPAERRALRAEPRERVDDTKNRLLLAAIEVFGRHGFESATTRMLAEAADANLQSIPYYFGGKAGLYLAVAEFITERIRDRMLPLADAIRAQLPEAGSPRRISGDEARALLQQILTAMAHLLLHDESAPWARLMIREQMDPTTAFDVIYERVLSPMLELVRALVGMALGKDPNSEQVRLRTISAIGQILVLRAARATLMRQLSWKEVGDDELAAVDMLVVNLVRALAPPPTAAPTLRSRARRPASTHASEEKRAGAHASVDKRAGKRPGDALPRPDKLKRKP